MRMFPVQSPQATCLPSGDKRTHLNCYSRSLSSGDIVA